MCTGTSHTSIMCLKLSVSESAPVRVTYIEMSEIDRGMCERNLKPFATRTASPSLSPSPSPTPSAVAKQLKLSLKVLALSNVRNLWQTKNNRKATKTSMKSETSAKSIIRLRWAAYFKWFPIASELLNPSHVSSPCAFSTAALRKKKYWAKKNF